MILCNAGNTRHTRIPHLNKPHVGNRNKCIPIEFIPLLFCYKRRSNILAIRRGVLHRDMFTPLQFCVGLDCIFRDYDLHCEVIDVNTDPNIECRISKVIDLNTDPNIECRISKVIDVNTDPNIECRISTLKYADDVALLNTTTADANIRLESLSRGFLEAASMEIRVDKTSLMHIHPKLKASPITIGDVAAVGFTYKCPVCPRTFPTKFPRGFALFSCSECRYNGHNCHCA